MLYATLKVIHLLSLVVWLGGMVFALFFLRPAAGTLAPPQRLVLMRDVLGRFLKAVGLAVVLLLLTGAAMLYIAYSGGAGFRMPMAWMLMIALGILMMAIFGHLHGALYKRLVRAVAASDWPAGGAAMERIRVWVSVNLALGVLIVLVMKLAV